MCRGGEALNVNMYFACSFFEKKQSFSASECTQCVSAGTFPQEKAHFNIKMLVIYQH